ncbi:MAG: copper homeostasis protein [Flavobacteriales bacterium]|nr:copper homeostasis protein [Flavobacteriales bacterium]|tara:strand:+ start:889 stop:1515 length:627 start_codon:yes stop_codon:yes gene_type:complete
MDILKEACVDNIDDAINAFKLGADRLEYCSNLDEDGLTPSKEELVSIKKLVSIPIRVMVRPHSKSFNYSESDLLEMKNTIEFCKNQNFDGVVFGCLKSNGQLDIDLISKLANYSKPLNVIIHKAIDFTKSPLESLKELIELKTVKGVLSSGGAATAELGIKTLKNMVDIAPQNFEIIVAGKITNINIDIIHKKICSGFYHGKKIVGEL